MPICTKCTKEKATDDFYHAMKRGKRTRYNYCKPCFNLLCTERYEQNRLRAISLLGGVCQDCGNENPIVLDFHHLDPSIKQGRVGKMLSLTWSKIELELATCHLLCANCHRIRHATSLAGFEPACDPATLSSV